MMTTTHSSHRRQSPKPRNRTIDRISLTIFVVMVAVLVYGLVAVAVQDVNLVALAPVAIAVVFAGVHIRN